MGRILLATSEHGTMNFMGPPDLRKMPTRALLERKTLLCQAKHKGSPGRRIRWIEKEVGKIRRELGRRRRGPQSIQR